METLINKNLYRKSISNNQIVELSNIFGVVNHVKSTFLKHIEISQTLTVDLTLILYIRSIT